MPSSADVSDAVDGVADTSTSSEAAPAGPLDNFKDLNADDWYLSPDEGTLAGTDTLYLEYVVEKGLMAGYTNVDGTITKFGPHDPVTRCQAAAILYRLADPGAPNAAARTGFTDCPADAWYGAAVKWCAEAGIITGYEDADGGHAYFGPDDAVTRAQIATMIYRYCTGYQGAPASKAPVKDFWDYREIAPWALDGVSLCRAQGIMSGYSSTGALAPGDNAERCQMAKIIAIAASRIESGEIAKLITSTEAEDQLEVLSGRRAAQLWTELDVTEDYRSSFDHGYKGAEFQKYIVLHDTAGEADGLSVVNGWDYTGAGVAAHFIVNKDGSIVQCVGLDRITHHAGFGDIGHNAYYGVEDESRDDKVGTVSIGSYYPDYGMNSYSVGIEIVHVAGTGYYPQAQLEALDKLIAYIDAYYGFESEIIDHKMWRTSNPDTSPEFADYLANYRDHRTYW